MKTAWKVVIVALSTLVFASCGGPLKVVPSGPSTLPDNFYKQNTAVGPGEQWPANEARYTLTFPDGVELSKAFYSSKTGRLYIPAKSKKEFEYMALNLADGQVLWTLKLPDDATPHRLSETSTGDLWLDVFCHGQTLVFLDPASGEEKWRYGAGAKEKRPMPFKLFVGDKYNIFLGGKKIFVQDAASYKIISETDRYETDLQGGGVFKGNTMNYAPFYNTNVIDYEDQVLVLDHGAHAFSKQTGEKLWSVRFPAIATRYHTGENAGKAVAGAFLAVLTGVYSSGSRPPDVVHPKTLVLQTDHAYYFSSLSNLFCIDKATGAMDWARRMNLGYTNLIEDANDRIYLVSVGDYANGFCAVDKTSGSLIPCTNVVSPAMVEANELPVEEVAGITENKMWFNNRACYDAMMAKEKIAAGERQFLATLALPADIAILASDSIYFINKSDGTLSGSVPNPGSDGDKYQEMLRLDDETIAVISANKISAIRIGEQQPVWEQSWDWGLKDLGHFSINSISGDYLYARVVADKKIKGVVLDKKTGEKIREITADQTLYADNFLAVQNNNQVSIYLQQP